MRSDYSLPDWDFVAGSTQRRSFILYRNPGEEYDLKTGTADLAIVEYAHQGDPVITKQVGITPSVSGNYCRVSFSLTSQDSKDLEGAYLYQVMIKDGSGSVSIPFHGLMHIQRNLQKSALS